MNTAELFLPHYNADALESVLADEVLPIPVETATVEYPRNTALSSAFTRLETLAPYSINRAPKMGEVKRLLRLAGMLLHGGIDQDADENVRDVLTKRLRELRDHYAKNDPEWGSLVREGGEIEIEVTKVAAGDMNVTGRQGTRMIMSDENIDASGRFFAVGEGLHRTCWKRYHSQQKPNDVKLELFALIRRAETIVELESWHGHSSIRCGRRTKQKSKTNRMQCDHASMR